MKQYISEDRAMYEDLYHGAFSRKLAKWAISKMEMLDPATKTMKPVTVRPVDEVMDVLKANDVEIPEQFIYSAWYLFMMAIADYPKTLLTDKQRATFVEETLLDPDGTPCNVLDCFVAKMCNADVTIFWERFI